MKDMEFGPVEFYVVSLGSEGLSPAVIRALGKLQASKTIRLLDLVVATVGVDGEVSIAEVDQQLGESPARDLELVISGLISEEDIVTAVEGLPGGQAVAVAAFELTWALELAQELLDAGAQVVRADRIPAPVVNGVVEAAEKATR